MDQHDALARKRRADVVIDRAAQELRDLLEDAAKSLRPFPPFPGAFFTNAVEVNLEGVERADIGPVVVGEDGRLYELEIEINFEGELGEIADPVQAREERLKKLEDLHPRDEIILAYNALAQLTAILMEKGAEPA